MRILDFTERLVNAPKTPSTATFDSPNNFVTLDSFNALKGDVEALMGKFDELNSKPVAKSKKAEVENHE